MVDTQQPAALTIIGIALGISTLFVIFRICARVIDLKDGRPWDTYIIWSDVLIGIAYLLVAAETYVIIRYTLYTWQGYHLVDIPKLNISQQVRGQKYNLANQLLYNPILSLVKASVILFLLHIVGTKQWVRRALWAVFVVNFMLAVAIFIADAFQCTPFNYVFDYPAMDAAAQKAAGADSKGKLNGVLIKGGKCFDQIKFFLISAGLAVATDLLVVGIPIFIVWDLKMARRKKIIVSSILGVGLIVTGVSIARLVVYAWRFSPRNHDRTYGVGYTVSSLEANLAIATGCVPSFGSLVRRISPRILGSTNYASRPTPSGYLQQSGERKSRGYALQTVNSNKNGWEGPRCRVGAWSSDENILPGPEEIRKEINVEVTYGEALSIDGAKEPGKHSL